MKIGSLDLSYRVPIYLGIVVFALLFLLNFWRHNADTRMESIYRDRILRGVFDDNTESLSKAIDACRTLTASQPQKLNVRLYLATLLFRDKDNKASVKEARQIWDAVAAEASASADEKAWALVGSGVANFALAEPANQAKAAEESARLFEKALGYKKSADAMVNLALAHLPKGGPGAVAEAQKWCDEALRAPEPASLRAQAQLYTLQGWLLTRQNKPADALAAFARAQFIRPDRDDLVKNKRLVTLASVVQKDLTPEARRGLLKKLESDFNAFGDQAATALNVAGQGWMMLKGAPDYMTAAYPTAHQLFTRATQQDPKDPRGYRNLSALIEDRIADLSKSLVMKITGFNGETPASNLWTQTARVGPTVAEQPAINEIKTILSELDSIWQNCAEKMPTPELKSEAKLRQLACVRREIWFNRAPDGGPQPALVERALKTAEEAVKLNPNNGEVYFALGQVLMERGEYSGATKAFQDAKAKDSKAPTLEALLTGLLACKTELVDVRPSDNRHWFGDLPLISARLKSFTSTANFKEIKMLLDNKNVTPIVVNSEIFFVPDNGADLDGNHTVAVSATDSMGNVVSFPPVSFGLDRQPPTLRIVPDPTVVLTNKPEWTITLSDDSGINLNKIDVTLKSSPQAAIPIGREIVKEGKYKFSFPDLKPPVKVGANVGESFKFGAGQELPPGEYTLFIVAQDLEGNTLKVEKIYTVK